MEAKHFFAATVGEDKFLLNPDLITKVAWRETQQQCEVEFINVTGCGFCVIGQDGKKLFEDLQRMGKRGN